MGSPTWHDKSVAERLELVHAVWEGRAVGTWQLAGTPHFERVFPGYSRFEQRKAGDESGSAPLYWATAEAAESFAALPWPAGAYALVPPSAPATPALAPGELPVFETWELLSWEEWGWLEGFLHYPPPAEPDTAAPPAEAG